VAALAVVALAVSVVATLFARQEPAGVTEVFLIPHVHVDTGSEITFEQYYEQLVSHILSTTVSALAANNTRSFC
jgi:hypothetical protein